MAEERSCLNCGYYNADRCVRPAGCCFHHSEWQPIAKPKVQMTEEEFIQMMSDLGWTDVTASSYVIKTAKQKGYIRKSELVELVEEAEEVYYQWKDYLGFEKNTSSRDVIEKQRKALKILKKDHPEFGGKK